jgi:glycosyltransferase involved in cell wall biosynthesis
MRILNVTPFRVLPTQVGGAVRIFNLMSRLAESHEVTGFSLVSRRPFMSNVAREFRHRSGYTDIQFSNPLSTALLESTRRCWVNSPVLSGLGLSLANPGVLEDLLYWSDVVVVEYPWQFSYCRNRCPGKPVVYASHNVEVEKFSSFAAALGGRPRRSWLTAIRLMEANAVRRADLVITVSDSDKRGLERRYDVPPRQVISIPDGADPGKYRQVTDEQRRLAKLELGLPCKPTVIFMGGSSALPNRIGAEWVRKLAALERGFTFVITGASGSNVRRGNLVETGVVPDVAPYLRAADMSVVPIQYGGGVKLKLLESLAAGLPTVAFSESLTGTDVHGREHVLIAEKNAESLLSELRALVKSPELAKGLARSGRRIVKDRHNWDCIGVDLEAVLTDLVRRHSSE